MARSAPGSLWSRSVRTPRGLRVASRLSARQKKRRAASWGGFLVPLGAGAERRSSGPSRRPLGRVAPWPIDPNIRLVDGPWPAARPQVAAHPLLQLGGEALDPAREGGGIDRHPTVGQPLPEVATADRKRKGPAHGPEDDLGWAAEAAERAGGGHGPPFSSCALHRLALRGGAPGQGNRQQPADRLGAGWFVRFSGPPRIQKRQFRGLQPHGHKGPPDGPASPASAGLG